MTVPNATAEVFWTAFRALPRKEREAVVEKLIQDEQFMEDLMDLVLLKQREQEPSRPLRAYLAEREGRL